MLARRARTTMLTATGTLRLYRHLHIIELTYRLTFKEGSFALIHIPLDYYPFFIQPIQRLLFGEDLADRFFAPLVDRFNGLLSDAERHNDHVQILPEDFNVIQVDGQGLDAGQRVLELTSPLAMAGM